MTSGTTANLELFESEFIQDFPKINITSIVDYYQNIIIGDSSGNVRVYKKENSKLVEFHNIQLKSKIDKLIVIPEENILYILSGGNLLFYELQTFHDRSPKDSDKESKDFKDIAKIYQNQNPKNKNDLMIITKKKKMLFFSYQTEMQRLLNKDYKDKEGKQFIINLDEIPERLIWNGNSICFYIKGGKVYFYSIKTENGITTSNESTIDLPTENIIYIQSSWSVLAEGCGLFFDTNGQGVSKNAINFDPNEKIINLEVFNDLHIIALYSKNICIYDCNDGQCVQELTLDNNFSDYAKKSLTKGNERFFVISSNKKDEKSKDFICKLWEIKEVSFEKQIKLSIKSNQIEKALGILNNKLDFNMPKFNFLESFYCDCAWNSINKKSKEGYEEAEQYFSLCNFNPFELIYHFIKLLKIKPIHAGFEDENKLKPDVVNCQIYSGENTLNDNIKSALRMLINVLQTKKTYILTKYKLINTQKEKGKNIVSFEAAKNNSLKFDSSQNCQIYLKNVEPKDIKLFETLKIINEALVKSMVLLNVDISLIEEVIEEDKYKTDFSEEFLLKINTFMSNMALAYIYKKKKKYNEALKLLEPYIDNNENEDENKYAVNLFKKILISFGKNQDYAEIFEQGLKILLKKHYTDCFETLLCHELISVDKFLENILNDEPSNLNKRETFLKMLCDEKKYENYSNEKYQTLYLELLINKLFSELKKESIPENKQNEKFPKEYQNLKELFKKYKNYNKSQLLEKIKDSWMYDIEIYLLSQLQKTDEAIKKLIDLVKTNHKEFEDIREFCKINYSNDMDIFKKYFKNLREKYDDKSYEDMKLTFKKEMLKLIDLFINGELLDQEAQKNKNKLELLNLLNPKEVLTLIPSDWKLNESLDGKEKNKTIYNLMHFYLKEYAIINNNYKRLENLAKMDLTYKQKKLFEIRDKHVALDINSSCFLCGKKITNNTQFLIYPNGHIYHSRCSPDLHLEIKTGKNFQNFDY